MAIPNFIGIDQITQDYNRFTQEALPGITQATGDINTANQGLLDEQISGVSSSAIPSMRQVLDNLLSWSRGELAPGVLDESRNENAGWAASAGLTPGQMPGGTLDITGARGWRQLGLAADTGQQRAAAALPGIMQTVRSAFMPEQRTVDQNLPNIMDFYNQHMTKYLSDMNQMNTNRAYSAAREGFKAGGSLPNIGPSGGSGGAPGYGAKPATFMENGWFNYGQANSGNANAFGTRRYASPVDTPPINFAPTQAQPSGPFNWDAFAASNYGEGSSNFATFNPNPDFGEIIQPPQG